MRLLGSTDREVSRHAWYLTVAFAFAIHNAEEATTAPSLLQFMQSSAPLALRAFYEGINASELRVSLTVLTFLGFVATTFAARSPHSPRWAYVMLVFAAVIGVNALAHLVLASIFRTYMPGLITAVIVTLPVAAMTLLRARHEKWVASTAYWTVLPAALLVHGPVLALFIETTIGTFRLLTGSAA